MYWDYFKGFKDPNLNRYIAGGDPCPYSNTCANRKCYSNEEQCNGKDDCGDGSDEWECGE